MRWRVLLAMVLAPMPALAALQPGTTAPEFSAAASKAGQVFTFSLADSLKKGPVVLYFYPAAFTPGCTAEAHAFADASADYAKLGATLIGVSQDEIGKLQKFSVSECRSKFAVAADPGGKISAQYDALLLGHSGFSARTSYVITPDDKVLYAYNAMDPDQHVANTMNALKKWRAANP